MFGGMSQVDRFDMAHVTGQLGAGELTFDPATTCQGWILFTEHQHEEDQFVLRVANGADDSSSIGFSIASRKI